MNSELPDFANQNFRVYIELSEYKKEHKVSGAAPYNSCTYKNDNLSKNTSIQWRASQIHKIISNTIDIRIFT
jgi:hypothetical protein